MDFVLLFNYGYFSDLYSPLEQKASFCLVMSD